MRVFLAIILLSILATTVTSTSAAHSSPAADYIAEKEAIDNSISDAYSAMDNNLEPVEPNETIISERLESVRKLLAERKSRINDTGEVDADKITQYITKSDRIIINGDNEVFHIVVELEINASGRKFNKQFITSDQGRIRYGAKTDEANENAFNLTMSLFGKSLYSVVDLEINSKTKTPSLPFPPDVAFTRCEMEIGQVMTYNTPHFFDFGSCSITVTLHTGQDLMVIGSAQLLK